MTKKSIWFAMATVALAIIGFASKAQAVGIDYRTLETSVPQKGTVALGNNTTNPEGWSYYNFSGNAGDKVTLNTRSINSELDPVLGVWEGLATDTDQFSSIYDVNNDDLSQIAFADNKIANPDSSGGNRASFTLPTTGGYTVAVTSHNSDSTTETLHEVPEPLTILGSLTAIGVGGFLKRKYSLKSQLEEKS